MKGQLEEEIDTATLSMGRVKTGVNDIASFIQVKTKIKYHWRGATENRPQLHQNKKGVNSKGLTPF